VTADDYAVVAGCAPPGPSGLLYLEVGEVSGRNVGLVDDVQLHHVGKLADLDEQGAPPSGWRQLMAKRQRKTLVVCFTCHDSFHTGQPTATLTP